MRRIFVLIGFCFLSGTFSSCDKIAKKVILKSTEEATETASKKLLRESLEKSTSKNLLEKGLKGGIKESLAELPKGRKALQTIQHLDGSYTPELNNLGRNASAFGEDFNKLLLKERRAAICPYDQFPTLQQLAVYDKSKLKLIDEPNAAILKQNMFVAMDKKSAGISTAFGGNAAHHVVEGSDPSALKSRELLKKFNVNINAPENGILLPENMETSIYKGTVHKTHHTKGYSSYVYEKIKDAKSREELIIKLQDIKSDLYSGKLNLQGVNQELSKNIVF